MPIPLLAGAVIASATSLPTVGGMGVGSLVSGLFVCYSLFVATPTG